MMEWLRDFFSSVDEKIFKKALALGLPMYGMEFDVLDDGMAFEDELKIDNNGNCYWKNARIDDNTFINLSVLKSLYSDKTINKILEKYNIDKIEVYDSFLKVGNITVFFISQEKTYRNYDVARKRLEELGSGFGAYVTNENVNIIKKVDDAVSVAVDMKGNGHVVFNGELVSDPIGKFLLDEFDELEKRVKKADCCGGTLYDLGGVRWGLQKGNVKLIDVKKEEVMNEYWKINRDLLGEGFSVIGKYGVMYYQKNIGGLIFRVSEGTGHELVTRNGIILEAEWLPVNARSIDDIYEYLLLETF